MPQSQTSISGTADLDHETQQLYQEAARRGLLKSDPEMQHLGHELRRRGIVHDPTQGGLVNQSGLSTHDDPGGSSHDPYGDPADGPAHPRRMTLDDFPAAISHTPSAPISRSAGRGVAVSHTPKEFPVALSHGKNYTPAPDGHHSLSDFIGNARRNASEIGQALTQVPDLILQATGNDPAQYQAKTLADADAIALHSQRQAAQGIVKSQVEPVIGPQSMLGHGYQAAKKGTLKSFIKGVPAGLGREAYQHPVNFALNTAAVASLGAEGFLVKAGTLDRMAEAAASGGNAARAAHLTRQAATLRRFAQPVHDGVTLKPVTRTLKSVLEKTAKTVQKNTASHVAKGRALTESTGATTDFAEADPLSSRPLVGTPAEPQRVIGGVPQGRPKPQLGSPAQPLEAARPLHLPALTAAPEALIAPAQRVAAEVHLTRGTGTKFTPTRADDLAAKADPKTGMTPAQKQYLSDALTNYAHTPEASDAPAPPYRSGGQRTPENTAQSHRIQVPGDGEYTVQGLAQANALHVNLTGKGILLTRSIGTGEPLPEPIDLNSTFKHKPGNEGDGPPIGGRRSYVLPSDNPGLPKITVPAKDKVAVLAKYAAPTTGNPLIEGGTVTGGSPAEASPGASQPVDPGAAVPPGNVPTRIAPAGSPMRLDPSAVSSMGVGGLSPLAEHLTDALGEYVRQNIADAKDMAGQVRYFSQGGRYRASYGFSKDAGDALNTLAASRESGALYAHLADRYVHAGLSPDQRDLLGRYYADQRGQGLEGQGITTHNVPMLSPAERHRVASDPKLQQAITRFEAVPGSRLLALRKFVSPRLKPVSTPSGHFASLIPADNSAGAGQNLAGQKPGVPGRGGSLASQQRMKGSRFAGKAGGQAQDGYTTDLGENLRVTVPEVLGKANQRDLYKTLLRQRDGTGSPLAFTNIGGKKLPEKITWEGLEYPASRPFEISTAASSGGKLVTHKMVVPQPMEADIHDVTAHMPQIGHIGELGKRLSSFATALSLTSPAEVLFHANRVLSLGRGIPGLGPTRAGTLLRLVNLDMSHPDNLAALQRLMDANAGSARPFQENLEKSGLQKLPVVGGAFKKAADFNHGTLFGLPRGKGAGQVLAGHFGLDLRLRVAAENIRAKLEGQSGKINTDPKRIREFANQFGQYTSKPDRLIEAARGVHPFAASSLPMRVTELRQILGGTGVQGLSPGQSALLRARSLAAGTGGTVLGMIVLNHALSGHWPWQNAPGHEFDVEAGHDADGKPVYIAGNVLAPTLMRPLRMTGLPDMAAALRSKGHPGTGSGLKGNSDGLTGKVAGEAAMRGIVNSGFAEASSPLSNALLAAGTGRAPYVTKSGDFLRVSPPATKANGESQVTNNLKTGVGQLNPLIGLLTGTERSKSGSFVSPVLRGVNTLQQFTGPVIKKDPDKKGRSGQSKAGTVGNRFGSDFGGSKF